MEILSQKQLIKELDRINQEAFKYVGVWHIRSGYRPEVESNRNFIDNLNAKPIREIKIRNPPTPQQREIEKYAITTEVSPAYVNIYNVDDVKDKLRGISKHKCIVICKWGDEPNSSHD